ncbi:hypothetical protein ACH4A7_37645 [Streptomyces cyaneofuscatus]|uniref:hypothetical protein n=1 Tax=Streptomyces cyaneofuscatus TaxID=66883 RepID=UPI0037913002
MSTTLDPEGDKPEGQPDPEQSGAARSTEQDKSQGAGKSLARATAEGAGVALGTAVAGVVFSLGVTAAGAVMAEMQDGPHQGTGGAASTPCNTA